MSDKKNDISLIEKISTFIVDKRKGFFLVYCILIVFSCFSISWVKVNDDITTYLPSYTETRKGLTLMDNEFLTYGTARIMVSNITYDSAAKLKDSIKDINGVSDITFDNTEDHYKSASALFDISFSGEANDPISKDALNSITELLDKYDYYISSEVNKNMAASLASEISYVLILSLLIIIGVLLFTSKTYMEIPVLMVTFGIAALLNLGTNYLYGEISFVSNSISGILQLALAIDYAIILCHRFTEERAHLSARNATIKALSKAIPEISSSSLTTISGLAALMFMQFTLGFDMGIVLIKALIFSLVTVFTLMPGLLMLFSNLMDRTKHKNFVPKINIWGKIVVATRFVVPVLFMILLCFAFYMSSRCNYVFGYSMLTTKTKNDTQIAKEKIQHSFGSTNILAMVIPSGNFDKESALIEKLDSNPDIQTIVGLANISAIDDYVLTDALTPRAFAELTDLDIEITRLMYSGYALETELYGRIVNGLDSFRVPLIDMLNFLIKQNKQGYVTLDEDIEEKLDSLQEQLHRAESQLKSSQYTRLLLKLSVHEEGAETFELLHKLHEIAGEFYDEVYLVGPSTSNNDLSNFFTKDNIIISILSALFVMLILLFTFKSAGIPVLLVLTIQGSIWINFSFPSMEKTNIFFLSYLVVTAIQMGATIDYAIVITSRYLQLKKVLPIKKAMIEALNQAFPTIITSGTILASSGLLIGELSSDYAISSIGTCLGRGTIISLILVMGVLPQTLLLGDILIEKTAFTIKKPYIPTTRTGYMKFNGRIRGYVTGFIDGDFNGSIKGDMNALVDSQSKLKEGSNHDQD